MTTEERVKTAYEEGFEAGANHQNIPWRYPPVAIAWFQSEARAYPNEATYLPSTLLQTKNREWKTFTEEELAEIYREFSERFDIKPVESRKLPPHALFVCDFIEETKVPPS